VGYDLYCVGDHPEVTPAREALRAAVQQHGYRSNEAKAAIEQVREAERQSYFRLNMWGMGVAREAMFRAEMLNVGVDHPPWPKYDPARDEDHEGELTAEYEAKAAVVTDSQPGIDAGNPGIPVYKFGSNDGWLVTPAEIETALTLMPSDYRPEYEGEWIGWWTDWVEFLRHCQGHGGFRVW
jgi:hypothetical protein